MVCSGCEQTILDYVELQNKLATIENAFAIKRNTAAQDMVAMAVQEEQVHETILPDNSSVFDPEDFDVKESIIHTDEVIEDHVEMTEGELEQAILFSPGSIEHDATEIVVSGKVNINCVACILLVILNFL